MLSSFANFRAKLEARERAQASHTRDGLDEACIKRAMAGVYEEVEIEDLKFDAETQTYTYPCPCGDKFSISLEELHEGEDIATCPSCTLRIRVIFDAESLPPLESEDDVVAEQKAEGKEAEAQPQSDAKAEEKTDSKDEAEEKN